MADFTEPMTLGDFEQLERDLLHPSEGSGDLASFLDLDSPFFGSNNITGAGGAAPSFLEQQAAPSFLQDAELQQLRSESAEWTEIAPGLFPLQDEPQNSGAERQDSGDTDSGGIASAPNGGGSGAGHQQLSAVKEKNRLAQAKYRARQRKKRQETSAQVAELTKQLAELQKRQAEMVHREVVFARFISSQRLALTPQYPGMALASPRVSQLTNDNVTLRTMWADGCQDFKPPFEPHVWMNPKTQKFVFNVDCGTSMRKDVLTFTAREGGPVQMTREEVTHMTPAGYGALYQDIINGLAACLLQAKGDLESPAGKRLLELCCEARDLKKTLDLLRPDTVAAHARDVAAQHGPPQASLWAEIAGSLTLAPAQRENCILLRNAAFENLGALMRQREELGRKLMMAPAWDGSSSDYLGSTDAKAQLQSMLREENSFAGQMMMALFGRVLTPMQTAHAHVLAFPYELNALSFLDAIANLAPEAVPAAAELMQKGAATAEVPPLCAALEHLFTKGTTCIECF